VCTMYDDTGLAQEIYPDHEPLGLKVVMQAYAWEDESVDDFIAFDFTITNVGSSDIDAVYLGFLVDCDIGRRGDENIENNDMVGTYQGQVRASDGSFQSVTVAYMYDGDPNSTTPGYFGMMFLTGSGIRSFQAFAAEQPYEMGGDATNDAERYELMSRVEWDADTAPGDENDYRFLISTGPVGALGSKRSTNIKAAMVMGADREDMLLHCAEVARTYYGSYWDLDLNPATGVGGRETYMCREWLPINPNSGRNEIYSHDPDYWNDSCVPIDVALNTIVDEDLTVDRFGNHCIWVNLDNCEECTRRAPGRCTEDNRYFLSYWNCNDTTLTLAARQGCTGIGGRESQVHWLTGGMAPPPPGLRLWTRDNRVHIYWDDYSQTVDDIFLDLVDFESYRIWRADKWDRPFGSSLENGPASDLWRLVAEYDLVNYYTKERSLVGGGTVVDTLPFGYNTGLDEIHYHPACLDDPRFSGLAAAMQEVVTTDSLGMYAERPHLRDQYGSEIPELAALLPWEGYPTVLDTFFRVTGRDAEPGREIVPKHAATFFEFIDHNIHNGFIYFYSVTATDHELGFDGNDPIIVGGGQIGDPGTSFEPAVPGFAAQSAADRERQGVNIFVYPNPATTWALAEYQQLHANADDPTGKRITFANLPQARNYIHIFTLDGDLVTDFEHDGSDGYGQVDWNLVSRNGQQVVSGIYLYVVHSEDDRFEDFIGKFVVIQ
ncbi:MAG: hypothetical protein ABIF77_15215, partial [bacterium]